MKRHMRGAGSFAPDGTIGMKRFAWTMGIGLLLTACGAATDPEAGAGGAGGGAGSVPEATYDLSWDVGEPFPTPVDHHVSFVHETPGGAFLHVIGGFSGGAIVADAWSAPIGADGSLGTWTATLALPSPQAGHALAKEGDRVLVIGGMPAVNGKPSAAVRVGRLGDDGGIDSWTEGRPLPAGRFHAAAATRGRDVWVVGGIESAIATAVVFHAVLGDDGAPSAWEEVRALPEPRSHEAVFVRGGFLYVVAGLSGNPNDDSAISHADVWRAALHDDGSLGEWEEQPELPKVLAAHSATVAGRSVFVMGGLGTAGPSAAVFRADFADDNSLGPWQEMDPLPQARVHVHQSPIWGNHVYRIAGSTGGMQPKKDVAIGILARIDEAATRSSP